MGDLLGGSRVGIGGLVDGGGGGGGSSDCEREVGSSACCGRGCCAVECRDVECCAVGCDGMSVRALFAGVACCVAFSLVGACARTVPCGCLGVGETKLSRGICVCLESMSSPWSLVPGGPPARSPCGCLSDIVAAIE